MTVLLQSSLLSVGGGSSPGCGFRVVVNPLLSPTVDSVLEPERLPFDNMAELLVGEALEHGHFPSFYRRATSMDLPMPMRFRHLKKTSKEAVGVYRWVEPEGAGLGGPQQTRPLEPARSPRDPLRSQQWVIPLVSQPGGASWGRGAAHLLGCL